MNVCDGLKLRNTMYTVKVTSSM